MAPTPSLTLAARRAKIARTQRVHGAQHPDTLTARRDYAAARLESYVEEIVASAPPLTEAQRRRIAAILDTPPDIAADQQRIGDRLADAAATAAERAGGAA